MLQLDIWQIFNYLAGVLSVALLVPPIVLAAQLKLKLRTHQKLRTLKFLYKCIIVDPWNEAKRVNNRSFKLTKPPDKIYIPTHRIRLFFSMTNNMY